MMTDWVNKALEHGRALNTFRMWKDDLNFAFGLFKLEPESCLLAAIIIKSEINDLVLVPTNGFFGWGGAPAVFGNFSKALKSYIVKTPITGVLDIYVDDLMGFSTEETAENDQVIAEDCISKVFGKGTVSEKKKIKPTTNADILGMNVNLLTEKTRPSDRACRKLLFAFFMVSTNESRWPLRQCQMLASLATRYSKVVTCMRMFVSPLNKLTIGSSKLSRKTTSEAKFCVEMWRVAAVMLYLFPNEMSVNIRSVVNDSAANEKDISYKVISDAGPEYLGVKINNMNDECIQFTSYKLPFNAKDPAYQNVREFMGCILAMILVKRLSKNENNKFVYLEWISDNI
jgi:hypothetical protein